jgi:hypothetical protein
MSYIKNEYLNVLEEEQEELTFEEAKYQRSAERAGEEALNSLGR